jgi:hypothetical protein
LNKKKDRRPAQQAALRVVIHRLMVHHFFIFYGFDKDKKTSADRAGSAGRFGICKIRIVCGRVTLKNVGLTLCLFVIFPHQ